MADNWGKDGKIHILFFGNGNTAAFKDGEQILELQKSWVVAWAEQLPDNIDPTELVLELSGIAVHGKFFRNEDGSLGWEFPLKRLASIAEDDRP